MRPNRFPKRPARATLPDVSQRAAIAVLVMAVLGWAAALGAPLGASAARSVGSRSQIEWVRHAATNFVSAELAGNGAGACGVLYAPLRATQGHRTCAQRWDAKLHTLLHEPGTRASLRADAHAIPSARVVVDGGYQATIDLPTPLMAGASRFVWNEMCWMLDR